MNKLLSALILLFSLAGCAVPEINTTTKSPSISGRVLDAETGTPLPGATIAFVDKPSIRCQTQADGSFAIDATHNVHLIAFFGMCGHEWPEGHQYTAWKISKPGYLERTFYAHESLSAIRDRVLQLGDVSLEREKKQPNQAPGPIPASRDGSS